MLKGIQRVLASRQNVRAHFWQSLANYTQAGGGMLLGIVLARLLEPSVFGEFVFITASLAFLMIPVSFSTAQLLISDAGKTPDLFTKVLGLTNVVCVSKLALVACYALYAYWNGNTTRATVSFLVGIPVAFSDYLLALRYDLEGRGLFRPNFFAQIIDIAAHATVSITLVLHGYGIYGLAMGGVVGMPLQTILYLRLSGRRLSPTFPNPSLLVQQIRSGLWIWLGSLASGWYFKLDKIILGNWGGSIQLGLYNRAMNYGPVSHVLLNSLATNATVRALANKANAAEKIRLFYKTMAILVTAGIANGLFWAFFADPIVPWVFGPQWTGAIPAFRVLGWLGVPYALAYGSSTVLLSMNRFRAMFLVHLFALLLLVCVMAILAYFAFLDAITASAAFSSCLFVGGIVMFMQAIRLLRTNKAIL